MSDPSSPYSSEPSSRMVSPSSSSYEPSSKVVSRVNNSTVANSRNVSRVNNSTVANSKGVSRVNSYTKDIRDPHKHHHQHNHHQHHQYEQELEQELEQQREQQQEQHERYQDTASTSMQTRTPYYPVSGKFLELHVPSVQPFHDKFQQIVPATEYEHEPIEDHYKPVDYRHEPIEDHYKPVDYRDKFLDHHRIYSSQSIDHRRIYSRKSFDHQRKSLEHERKFLDHQRKASYQSLFPVDNYRRKSLEAQKFHYLNAKPVSPPSKDNHTSESTDALTQDEVTRAGFWDYFKKPAEKEIDYIDITDQVSDSDSDLLDSEAIEAIAKTRIQKARDQTLKAKLITMKVQSKEDLRYDLFVRCLRCLLISPFFIIPCSFSSDWTVFEIEEIDPYSPIRIHIVFQHGPWRVCPCDATDWLKIGFIKYCKRTITDEACFGEAQELGEGSLKRIFNQNDSSTGYLLTRIMSALTIGFLVLAWLVAFDIYFRHVFCTRVHHSKASKRQVVFFLLCTVLACVAGIATIWVWFEQNYKWPGIGFSACGFSIGVLIIIAGLAHIVYLGYH